MNNQGTWTYPLKNLGSTYEVFATSPGGLTSEKVRFSGQVPQKNAVSHNLGKGLIEGAAEPESKVLFYIDKRHIGSTTADSEGYWSYTPTDEQPLKGHHDIKVIIADKQGRPQSVLQKTS